MKLKSLTITIFHVAILIILIMFAITITIQIEPQRSQPLPRIISNSELSFHLIMDCDSILLPDSVLVKLLSCRLKNLERAMFEEIVKNNNHFDKTDSNDIKFIKQKILEMEKNSNPKQKSFENIVNGVF